MAEDPNTLRRLLGNVAKAILTYKPNKYIYLLKVPGEPPVQITEEEYAALHNPVPMVPDPVVREFYQNGELTEPDEPTIVPL